MALLTNQDQRYYIIAKHSGLALTAPNSNMGTHLEQKILDPGNPGQRFRFFPRNYYYVVAMAEWGDRTLAVHGSLQGNGTPVIDWSSNIDEANQNFEFIPAAEGYYHIIARHSRKYLDIEEISKVEGKKLHQWELTKGDNQLFKLVQITDEGLKDNPASFAKVNEDIRNGAIAVIGKIPEAGGAIAFAVGLFWKQRDQISDLWDQMKSYVDVRIRQFLDAERLRTIRIDMIAHMRTLKERYDRIEEGSVPQGLLLDALLQDLIKTQELSWAVNTDGNNKAVEKTKGVLPYVLGLGTIILSIRQMMVTNYRKLYGTDPTPAVLNLNKKYLNEAVNEFTTWINGAKEELLRWRTDQIIRNFQSGHNEPVISSEKSLEQGEESKKEEIIELQLTAQEIIKAPRHRSYAKDRYSNWEICFWEQENPDDFDKRGAQAIANRRSQITTQFSVELDEMTSISKYWKYFASDVPGYEVKETLKEVGPYAGYDTTHAFEGPNAAGITKIILHGWKNGTLCGIELFYNGISNGLKGREGNEKNTLELEADEYISTIYGLEDHFIEAIAFSTNHGRLVSGGALVVPRDNRKNPMYFFADLHDNLKAKLVKVRGFHNGDKIQGLTFQWKYNY